MLSQTQHSINSKITPDTETTIDRTDTVVLSLDGSTTILEHKREENDSTSVCEIHSLGEEVSNPDTERYWENKYKDDYTGMLSGIHKYSSGDWDDSFLSYVFLDMMDTIVKEHKESVLMDRDTDLSRVLSHWNINKTDYLLDKLNVLDVKLYDSVLFDNYLAKILLDDIHGYEQKDRFNLIKLFIDQFQEEKWCQKFISLPQKIDNYLEIVDQWTGLSPSEVDVLTRILKTTGISNRKNKSTFIKDVIQGINNVGRWYSVQSLEEDIESSIHKLVDSIPVCQNQMRGDLRVKHHFCPSESQRKVLWDYLVSTPLKEGDTKPFENFVDTYDERRSEWIKVDEHIWNPLTFNKSESHHLKYYILSILDNVYKEKDHYRMVYFIRNYLECNKRRYSGSHDLW